MTWDARCKPVPLRKPAEIGTFFLFEWFFYYDGIYSFLQWLTPNPSANRSAVKSNKILLQIDIAPPKIKMHYIPITLEIIEISINKQCVFTILLIIKIRYL